MSVVLPEPDEPIIRMLPTRSLASFLARATEISRMASFWPITRRSSRAAICGGDGCWLPSRAILSPTEHRPDRVPRAVIRSGRKRCAATHRREVLRPELMCLLHKR